MASFKASGKIKKQKLSCHVFKQITVHGNIITARQLGNEINVHVVISMTNCQKPMKTS